MDVAEATDAARGASDTVLKEPGLSVIIYAVTSRAIFQRMKLYGLGWTSWKKRWFILTRNSLVFLKNDPGTLPRNGSEVNLALGGIDLNNSGSVVVREGKKLLTVLFPDGCDGRAFTLKAEKDLYGWKTALELAL